jgi:excisionase family DNA binding protein
MLYSVASVAGRLDVSEDTVRRLIAGGELTPIRIGSAVRIDAVDLEAFIARQRHPGHSSGPYDEEPRTGG